MPRENTSAIEERLMGQMRTCAHILHHRKGKDSQQRILGILRRGTMTQRDLTGVLDVRSASASEILSKVESNGFILRSKNEADKRNVDITLTKSGYAEAARIDAHRKELVQQMFACLTAEEKTTLAGLLEKLLTSWREHDDREECPGGPHHRPHPHHHKGDAHHD